MDLADAIHEQASGTGSGEKGGQRDQRGHDRQPATTGDPKPEQDDVARHVGSEHAAEPEIADGVDQAGRESQYEQRTGQRMAQARDVHERLRRQSHARRSA